MTESMEDVKDVETAFIIVCWNNKDIISEPLKSIKAQTKKNHTTIVVDNGSKDSSVDFIKDNFPWVEVDQVGANLGFAAGNNRGINRAINKFPNLKYIVFLNSDAVIEPKWLEVMTSFASYKTKGALFQSTTLDYYDHDIIDSTHIYISRNGSGTQANWRSVNSGYKGPIKVFGVNAAAAMISCSFIKFQPFEKLFDETLFMYLEDVDVSARATVMGWDNYNVPGTYAYHMGSASSNKKPGYSLYMTYRNNLAVLLKNIPLSMFLKMFPSIVRSDYNTFKHLKRIGQAEGISKIIKGRIIGLIRLPLFMPSIIKMHKYRKSISKEYLWQMMNRGNLQ